MTSQSEVDARVCPATGAATPSCAWWLSRVRWLPPAILLSFLILLAGPRPAAANELAPLLGAGQVHTWTFPSDNQGWWMAMPGATPLGGAPATWSSGRLALDWPNFGTNYTWLSTYPPLLTTPLGGTRGRLRFEHQVTGAFPNVEYRACIIGRLAPGKPIKVGCTPVRPVQGQSVEIAVEPGQGAWTTEGSWPAGSSTPLPSKDLAQLLHGVLRVYLQYRYGGALLCGDINQQHCQWTWDTTTVDNVELALWGPSVETAFASPNALAGDVVMLYARVRDADGNIVKRSSEITATVTGYAQPVTLDDALRSSDTVHGDGYHTALITVPAGQTSVAATLFYQGAELGGATLAVITDPQLAVLTDFSRLAQAFTSAGADPGEDLDADGHSDFYEMVDRLSLYAASHRGVVYDLGANVTAARGYSANYADYNYAAGQAAPMSGLAFRFLTNVHAQARYSIRAVALVGSDEVLPLYRMPNPINDTKSLASDVPYMFSRYVDPAAVAHPVPQIPAGRVFASRPGRLSATIDAYEKPLLLAAAGASLLCVDEANSLIKWDDICRTLIAPRLAGHYPGATRIYREAVAPWGLSETLSEIGRSSTTVLYTHGDMLRNGLAGGQYLTANDLGELPDSTGKLILNAGCWTGNHPAYSSPNGMSGLVQAALDRHLTYVGATDTGYGGNYSLVWDDYIWMHFLDALWQPRNTTVGSAWVRAWNGYYQARDTQFYEEMDWDPDGLPRLYTSSQAYAKSLTGLPTQPVQLAGSAVMASVAPLPTTEQAGPALLDATRTETITLDIPYYRWETLAGGAQRVLPATGGAAWGKLGMPVLPALHYQVALPPQVTAVTVTELTDLRQVERIGLVSLVTESTGIRCDCPASSAIATGRAITDVYPLRNWSSGVVTLTDGAQLDLFAILGQVDASGTLTLTKHMEFAISYRQPDTGVTLGALSVNDGAPLRHDAPAFPVRFSLTATQARQVALTYAIVGPDGLSRAAGESLTAVQPGVQAITLSLDGRGWPIGPLTLHVMASDPAENAPTLFDRRTAAIQVRGLALEATMLSTVVTQDGPAEVTIVAWNETGAPVGGLTSSFTARLDGSAQAVIVQADSPGRYRTSVPTAALTSGSHTLTLRAIDGRGVAGETSVAFGVAPSVRGRIYMPLLKR